MDNWYTILGVPENVKPDKLEQLECEARLEHHPDRHASDPPDVKELHAAKLKTWLDGLSFLLNKQTRDKLDEHLKATRAAAEAERVRRRNEEEAKRRDDADDLRSQFGGPTSADDQSSIPPPSPDFRPPTPTPARPLVVSPRSEAGVVLALDELPPVDWGKVGGGVGALVASLALLGSPFYIMSATGAASNDHLSGGWAIDLGCFALFAAGLIAVACVLGNMFSRD